jgi:hypothetical protein
VPKPTIPKWATGVNMREFAYYGTAGFMGDGRNTQQLQDVQLKALKDLDVTFVRFFATRKGFTPAQCIEKTVAAVNRIGEFGMRSIIALSDGQNFEFCLQEDEKNAEDKRVSGGCRFKLSYWDVNQPYSYATNYLPYVKNLAAALKTADQHDKVFALELGNELAFNDKSGATHTNAQDFLNFAKAVSAAIHDKNPNVFVSTGLINSRQIGWAWGDIKAFSQKLYALPNIDLMSLHYYEEDGERENGLLDVRANPDKPYYVGEFGAKRDADKRLEFYESELGYWKLGGNHKREHAPAITALVWAFSAFERDFGISDAQGIAQSLYKDVVDKLNSSSGSLG